MNAPFAFFKYPTYAGLSYDYIKAFAYVGLRISFNIFNCFLGSSLFHVRYTMKLLGKNTGLSLLLSFFISGKRNLYQ